MSSAIRVNYSVINNVINSINLSTNDVFIQTQLNLLLQVFEESKGEAVNALKKQAENLQSAYQLVEEMMVESKEMLCLVMKMYEDTDSGIAEIIGSTK